MLRQAAKTLKKYFPGIKIEKRGNIKVENLSVEEDVITAWCSGLLLNMVI